MDSIICIAADIGDSLSAVIVNDKVGCVMVDRKIAIVTTTKSKNQPVRQAEALKQNGLLGRWEVPNLSQKLRAEKMLYELEISNIEVKVVWN